MMWGQGRWLGGKDVTRTGPQGMLCGGSCVFSNRRIRLAWRVRRINYLQVCIPVYPQKKKTQKKTPHFVIFYPKRLDTFLTPPPRAFFLRRSGWREKALPRARPFVLFARQWQWRPSLSEAPSPSTTPPLAQPSVLGAQQRAMEGQDASPLLYVNGKRYVMPAGKAEVTLLAYLRGAPPRESRGKGHNRDSAPRHLLHFTICGEPKAVTCTPPR